MAIVDDEDAFRERLETYGVETWFAKPQALSPAVCASFGWSNVGWEKLQCNFCKATLDYSSPVDVLQSYPSQGVEEFIQSLEWEHDADCVWCENQCPSEFKQILRGSPESLFGEMLRRYKRFGAIWDLPDLNFCAESLGADVPLKLKALQSRLQTAFKGMGCSDDVTAEMCENRSWKMMLLALLGWEMKIMDYPLELEGSTEERHLVQRATVHRPEDVGYCLARQCVLSCPRCTAVLGLWSFSSTAEIPPTDFANLAKGPILAELQMVVDVETGEVEDLFQRFCPAGAIKHITTAPEASSRASTALKRSLSLDRESVGSRPVFGLQCLKKRKTSVEIQQPEQSGMHLDHTVESTQVLDPLEEHRHFCPYRSQWIELLEALVLDD